MNKEKPIIYIAHVVGGFRPLTKSRGASNGDDITLEIGTLSDQGSPRNWSRRYDEPKTSTGGCSARIFASDYDGQLFSWHGPTINYGDLADYEHAVRAVKRIAARMDEYRQRRPITNDAAEMMGRWLEAAGVTQVLARPEDSTPRQWLHDGEWELLSIARTISKLRACYPAPAPAAVVAA